MDQNNTLDDPTRAFDDLRREVSVGLRAVQGLAAEHRDQPDYSDTLKALDDRLVEGQDADGDGEQSRDAVDAKRPDVRDHRG